ncbi:hypothetical protein H0O02_05520 [Candidatus Micrarchaeota archaeon]|nr:hypothetical protein [Candidatus Micrarchaeota archaeon]
MAHMEILEIEDAVETFGRLLEIDPDSLAGNFYTAIGYLLLGDPQCGKYIRKAYKIDRKRTKQLLRNFFDAFIGSSPETGRGVKAKIEKELSEL